ncbi:unnamed protein product [Trifolium pratense]|uniref:Uncharacterized protein n=1 Tax=Trifolium pratense TaxID=57577 RepID=A0ACB0J9F7_TRIPR|nr:unnamed protein product [Trifolium pratense]
MAIMKTQMILLTKHTSVIILLLIVLLSFTSNLNKVSAASGGAAGGSFFDSDSDSSSSSDSFTSDSYSEYANDRHHHVYDSPSQDRVELPSGPILFFMVFTVGLFVIGFCNQNFNGNKVTVLKFQVAVSSDPGCTIQRDLTRIADAAVTSSKEGVSNLLIETIQALDKNLSYCIAGYSSVDIKKSKEDGQKCYIQQSIEEREKFDEETLVNLNNNNKTRIRSQGNDSFSNEETMFEKSVNPEKENLLTGPEKKYIVIILLVAAKGVHKLPTIDEPEDFNEAFQKLKNLLYDKLLAGEVLWTPQKEDDTLLDRKLCKDYPQLAKCMFGSGRKN